MSIFDKLLETDVEKLQGKEKRKYEVKRLSDVIGEPFYVTCKPLSNEQVSHIGEISKKETDMRLHVVLEACSIEGKPINNKELLDKLGVLTGKEAVEKLFLPGEIYALFDFVQEISGYGRNAVEEIKN